MPEIITLLPSSEHCELHYYPELISADSAQQAYRQLSNGIPWQQPEIRMFGRSSKIPRLQSWHGDAECQYQYSGLLMQPNPWNALLTNLRNKVEQASGIRFNSVLLNWYQHGQHSVGWHADDEPELGPDPVVAILSLGSPRKLGFKHRESGQTLNMSPISGSLLIMAGKTQTYWLHQISKTTRPVDGRISLTFRRITGTDS